VKIYCEANPEYYLTAKEDSVVLAPGDESNPYQVNYITFCTPAQKLIYKFFCRFCMHSL